MLVSLLLYNVMRYLSLAIQRKRYVLAYTVPTYQHRLTNPG
jgi:hypothetical protein